MKNFCLLASMLLFMLSCENDHNTMAVIDNGNDLRSPRISTVIKKEYTHTNDVNTQTINYTYNKQNLLIQKDIMSNNVETKEYFIYNQKKQLIQKKKNGFMSSANIKYNYSNVLYNDSLDLPVVTLNDATSNFHGATSQYQVIYTYRLDENNKATKLIATTSQHRIDNDTSEELPELVIDYDYNDKNQLISKKSNNAEQVIYQYDAFDKLISETSNTMQTLYTYNQHHLLIASQTYDTKSWKLIETKTYFYENKPYYYKQSPIEFLDQGQYRNSGIY
ncbi:MAG: hypothetical protein DSZ08_00510 [Sulfurovum sp.]|nr:MAG: hypothetical protein DSZ08_00510 [Sulfurovum sp.]